MRIPNDIEYPLLGCEPRLRHWCCGFLFIKDAQRNSLLIVGIELEPDASNTRRCAMFD